MLPHERIPGMIGEGLVNHTPEEEEVVLYPQAADNG